MLATWSAVGMLTLLLAACGGQQAPKPPVVQPQNAAAPQTQPADQTQQAAPQPTENKAAGDGATNQE